MLLEKNNNNKWNDVGFAIVFYISLAINISLVLFGIYKYGYDMTEITINESNIKIESKDIIYMLCFIPVASLFAFIWLFMMSCCASKIIKTTLILNAVILIATGLLAMLAGSTGFIGGCVLCGMALLSILWLFFVWNRIPFAEAVLSIAIDAFKQHWTPVLIHFLMGIVASFIALVDIGSIAVTLKLFPMDTKHDNHKFNYNIPLFSIGFIQLIFLYWHIITFTKIAFVTSCGVMVSWMANETVSVIKKFTQSCTILFGSICFGSLLEAIIAALKYVAKQRLENQDGENNGALQLCCIACVQCLLTIIGDILEYVNSYAYVYVAKDRHSYIESAKDVWNMFKKTGVTSLINDDLINAPFMIGWILIVLFVSIFGVYFVFIVSMFNPICIVGSLIVSMVIYSTMIAVLDAYVKVTFVCWAEDKNTFEKNQPNYHTTITQAAEQSQS